MKKQITKFMLCMTTALAIAVTATPVIPASAKTTGTVIDHTTFDEFRRQGRALKRGDTPERPSDEEANKAEVFSDMEKAGAYLKTQMMDREKNVIFSIAKENYSYTRGDCDKVYAIALKHTGKGNEGDYLNACLRQYNVSVYDFDDRYVFAAENIWFTTKEQEEELTPLINKIEKSLKWEDLGTEEDIIIPVYTYIMKNMKYDDLSYEKHMNGNDDADSDLSYSAYAAVTKKTAVCQGFASLLYRMLLDNGIENRILKSGTHAWNAVKCQGKWYYCDVTGDVSKVSVREANYFLQARSSFTGSDYQWKNYERLFDRDTLEGYDWAENGYYSLSSAVIRGFKKLITYSTKNQGNQSNISLKDANGNPLKEGTDYKITYVKWLNGKRMVVEGMGRYEGETLYRDYEVKLQAPKVTKITRQAKKIKGETYVRYRVDYKPVPGATYYTAEFDPCPGFSAFRLELTGRVAGKKNYIISEWHPVLQDHHKDILLGKKKLNVKMTAYQTKQKSVAGAINDMCCAKGEKTYSLPKKKNVVKFK
jgi:hypothetical protein